MKSEYGKLMFRFRTFWNIFKDRASNYKQNREIEDIAKEYELLINFDSNPKHDALIRILRKVEHDF